MSDWRIVSGNYVYNHSPPITRKLFLNSDIHIQELAQLLLDLFVAENEKDEIAPGRGLWAPKDSGVIR